MAIGASWVAAGVVAPGVPVAFPARGVPVPYSWSKPLCAFACGSGAAVFVCASARTRLNVRRLPCAPPAAPVPATHDTVPAAAAPDTAKHVETTLFGVKLGGYAEASYVYANHPVGHAIVGRLYDRFANTFTLNALKLWLDRPYATDKFDAGFHADVIFGQNARVLQSNGFNLGDHGDVTQLFVTLNVPTPNGNGLQFKVGKMVTLMGLEVVESFANPNWSEGNQFIYVENFTQLGVSAEYKFNKHIDAELRVFNGWDQVEDLNTHQSFMGRLGIAPDDLTSIALVGFIGPEEPNDNTALRKGADVVVSRKFGKATAWVQGDYGKEDANDALPDPTQDASWWALGGWFAVDLQPALALSLRGDYLDDREGARTAAAFGLDGPAEQKIWTGTLTLGAKYWANMLLRPEVRYDHSNLLVFDGKKDQVTVALSTTFIF